MTKLRIIDLFLSCLGFFLLSLFLTLIYIINLFFVKNPIYSQIRVGKFKKPFMIYKFRTMKHDTNELLSHEVPFNQITSFGKLMRKYKIDELPQLINVLRGEMSLVGPRPGLISDQKLIHYREKYDIYSQSPGITGLAQIKNIDMSNPKLLAKLDSIMIKNLNFKNYSCLIFKTFIKFKND